MEEISKYEATPKDGAQNLLINKIMTAFEYLQRKKVYGGNPNPVMKDIQIYVDLDKNKEEDNDTRKNTL